MANRHREQQRSNPDILKLTQENWIIALVSLTPDDWKMLPARGAGER